ncbi:SRPBCC family protein [Streptacidiphilus sp. 4-A2]|nr:SRPBCC family protein [Streptacidiphilus sp. 4-A2]
MESYQPVGESDHGLGAVFQAASRVGPSTLRSTVKAVQWEQNALLAYKSISGMESATSFVFTALGGSRCTVEFRIAFSLPGGIVGRTMEKTLEPFVQAVARNTAQNISTQVNAYHEHRSATSR